MYPRDTLVTLTNVDLLTKFHRYTRTRYGFIFFFAETTGIEAQMGSFTIFLLSFTLAARITVKPVFAASEPDFHYPVSEKGEASTARLGLPTCQLHTGQMTAVLLCGSVNADVRAGDFFDCRNITWKVEAVLSTRVVVISHAFDNWGIMAFVSPTTSPVFVRKSVGLLKSIDQPWFNVSDARIKEIAASNSDLIIGAAAKLTIDAEPDYPSIAVQLPPQRDTAGISHAADVNKFAVAYSGRIKCASTAKLGEDTHTGGIAELQDLHAKMYVAYHCPCTHRSVHPSQQIHLFSRILIILRPNEQKIVFDPADYLAYWPRSFANMKAGLLGGYLGVAQVGAFTAGQGGFELIAFSPVPPHEPGGVPAPAPPPTPSLGSAPPSPQPWHCHHWTPAENEAMRSGVPQKVVCARVHGQMWTGGNNTGCPGCGTCFCCSNNTIAPEPRLPNINYAPGVFVMLREETADGQHSVNGTRYFYASNTSTFELPTATGASTFYARLLAVQRKVTAQLAPMMQVELPYGDRRQRDMAVASILATTNNYVGNQPNYGFGATYWSYGREDNGSLPLNILSVDNALLEWGGCDLALAHIDFYFENYVANDGRIEYGPIWGSAHDSYSDLGRLIDIFIRAVRYCRPSAEWESKQFAKVSLIAEFGLSLLAAAPSFAPIPSKKVPCIFGPKITNSYLAGYVKEADCKATTLAATKALCSRHTDCGGVTEQYGHYECRTGNTPINGSNASPANSWAITNLADCHRNPATAGLVIGAPEHDWSGTTNLAFYNNNAWLAAGFDRLGVFLSEGPSTRNSSFAARLIKAGARLKAAINASVTACTVTGADGYAFVPPYAHVNATPYTSMFQGREASYANFRFFSEPLMASTMPSSAEASWLRLHNFVGGRLGGANRFLDHLDDMPSVGWGWGALANNRTDYFLALLYGHMATYQSAGTFHSTEQLSIMPGSGRYRELGKVTDPAPWEPPPSPNENISDVIGEMTAERVARLGYNSAETFISYCIVSNIIVALLTRWQLVMEENVGPARIWLGRGAPKRWFRAEGFNVTDAPTSAGHVSYSLEVHGRNTSVSTYTVRTNGSPKALETLWSMRWPGKISSAGYIAGCEIDAIDTALGIITVRSIASIFRVSADWTSIPGE